ncbi:MAG: TetR/AcrR family transcriptional regulator [Candidatus Obscuribacterales bacterium]|nr:TetR/AcrR family transcriptional regulator [Steroidobacteraceae bacterium]
MSSTAERRQEEKDRRRGEIVDAAIELYREVGWDAVTVDQVAKRARLSRALVYVYFKDKGELHAAIVLCSFEVLEKRFEEASSRARLGIDKVEALGRAYLAFAHELPHFFDACARFEVGSQLAGELSPAIEACFEAGGRVHARTIAALEAGVRDGSIRPDVGDLNVSSMALWGFSHGLIQIAIRKAHVLAHDAISVPQFVDHAVSMMRRMLVPTSN